jgi:hypothetical protein
MWDVVWRTQWPHRLAHRKARLNMGVQASVSETMGDAVLRLTFVIHYFNCNAAALEYLAADFFLAAEDMPYRLRVIFFPVPFEGDGERLDACFMRHYRVKQH